MWFKVESQENVADAIWDFLWDCVTLQLITRYVFKSFGLVVVKWKKKKRQPVTKIEWDFIACTLILQCLSSYLVVYHNNVTQILNHADERAAGDEEHLKKMLQSVLYKCNRLHEETGNSVVLNHLLREAAEAGDAFVVKKVLDCGAQLLSTVNKQNKDTALHAVVRVERISEDEKIEVVQILLDSCPPTKEVAANAKDERGRTALHHASIKNQARVCELLLQYGASRDAQDDSGQTPLHVAILEGKGEVIDVLIGKGKDDKIEGQDISEFNQKISEMVTCKDKDGQRPLDIALGKDNIKLVVKLLSLSQQPLPEDYLNNKKDRGNLLRQFAGEGNKDIVGKLLASGVNALDGDKEGKTCLHYAAMCADDNQACGMVKLILDRFEEKKNLVKKCDSSGKTVLHVAASKGHENLCRYFRSNYEELRNVKDADGRIPLYDAVEGKDDSGFIVPLLTDRRSWYRMTDSTGLTPLHVAASEGKIYQVDALLSYSEDRKRYVKKADYFGQTALHKAAKGGHLNTIEVLCQWGAQPYVERDCDRRTSLHYAVEAKSGTDGIEVVKFLLKKCGSEQKQLLFLCASAAGIGTADQNISDSPVKQFILGQREAIAANVKEKNLLRISACLGDIEMTKELLTRDHKMAEIEDQKWKIPEDQKKNVERVLEQIKKFAERGNDQPSVFDNLGRSDFAHGLAALLLNPYLNPPIVVGISGSWGMGKSSLMIQTESILLKTAAEQALLPYSELSEKYQEIERWVDFARKSSNKNSSKNKKKEKFSLVEFLNKYEAKYHKIFKSLAAMDSSDMFTLKGEKKKSDTESPTEESVPAVLTKKKSDSLLNLNSYHFFHLFPISHSQFTLKGEKKKSDTESPTEESVPAVLTVRYNSWKYRNESEALAGMAVEITREMEGIMTKAQWLSTCLRNTWRKQRQTIWINVIFPGLLAVFLAATFTWIVWVLLDTYNFKASIGLKYASLPATVVIIVWSLVKTVMSTLNPVSTQLMNYVKFPDHTEKLGYQERVISDISFLKEEIGKKPNWLCTSAVHIWHFITQCWLICFLFFKGPHQTMAIPRLAHPPNAGANLRLVVFVDDLDRCQESVILQVLSAINLVLAVCEISVVLGMDKGMIERAIMKKYGDKSCKKGQQLADKYLQKIIQLPLDLPDPSHEQSKSFLKGQLGVLAKPTDDLPESDVNDDSKSDKDSDYDDLFSPFDYGWVRKWRGSDLVKMDASSSAETSLPAHKERDVSAETNADEDITIHVDTANADANNSEETSLRVKEGGEVSSKINAARGYRDSVPIREMLFVRYSEGERDAIFYFQERATGPRKLPREWKRMLNYHRLIWNIFSVSNEAKRLVGWQVQLITWLFICWEWQENMDKIIENWNTIGILRKRRYYTSGLTYSPPPSLKAIVKSFTDNKGHTRNNLEDSENKENTPEKLKEDVKEKGVSKNTEDPESSSSRDLVASEEITQDKLTEAEPEEVISKTRDYSESSKRARTEKLEEVVKELGEQIKELNKEIKELKEGCSLPKRQASKTEKSVREKNSNLQSWRRLNSVLKRYDVSMDGIQAFQRFRFYCGAGHLPWPLREEESEEENE